MVKKEIVEELVELQRRIDRDRRQYELDAWMSLHLGIGQLKTLFFISNRGATTTGKLATALKVTPTNVTGIIDRLLEKNLITRTGDPDDRRVLVQQVFALATELREKLVNSEARTINPPASGGNSSYGSRDVGRTFCRGAFGRAAGSGWPD